MAEKNSKKGKQKNNAAAEARKLSAEVVDREQGVQFFTDIRMIRLKSYNHNLLIMEDYMPVIGEVTGYVEMDLGDQTVIFNPIHGFYMHKQNKFSLLIESHTAEIPEDEEAEAEGGKKENSKKEGSKKEGSKKDQKKEKKEKDKVAEN